MKTNKLRILIVNVHSQANSGDWAILLGQIRLIRRLNPDAEISITSRTSRKDRPLLAEMGIGVYAPVFNAAGFQPGNRINWLKSLLTVILPWQALRFLVQLKKCSLVLACGGGYFYSNRSFPGLIFWQNYLHLALAAVFNKPTVFFPQSFGPLASGLSRRLLAGLVESKLVRKVFAREAVSLELLRGLTKSREARDKISYCPDMAFYLDDLARPGHISSRNKPLVVLALRDWDFPGSENPAEKKRLHENYLESVLLTCRRLHREKGASFAIYSQARGPGADEDDRLFSGLIRLRLSREIDSAALTEIDFPDGSMPENQISLLSRADLLLTSRMHAAVFSLLAGTPAAVIAYQHKSLGILRTLELEDCGIQIEKLSPEALYRLCSDILRHGPACRSRIEKALSGIRNRIEQEFADPVLARLFKTAKTD